MRTAIYTYLGLLLTGSAMAQSVNPTADKTGNYAAVNPPVEKKGFRLLTVTAGADVLYYPSFLNSDWSDVKKGFGLDYTYGASLRVDIRPIRRLALSLNSGYYGFQLNRQFKLEGVSSDVLYTETQTFNQIPLQAGIKVYLTKGFYVMPAVGLTWVTTKVTTSANHPSPNITADYKTSPLTAGMGLGVEIHTNSHLLFDISLQGQYQMVNDFSLTSLTQSYSKPLSFTVLRLGVGFDTFDR